MEKRNYLLYVKTIILYFVILHIDFPSKIYDILNFKIIGNIWKTNKI